MNIAFSNARLIDPANGLDELGTLVVEKGKISAIGKNAKVPEKMKSHDCNGMAILPGLVDMQVFTGEPGEEYRETLATASQAAAAGGVTTMITMPNTNPVIDDAALVDFISRRARDTAIVRVHPNGGFDQRLRRQKHDRNRFAQRSGCRCLYRWRPRRHERADHAPRAFLCRHV